MQPPSWQWFDLYMSTYAAAAASKGVTVVVTQSPDKEKIPTEIIAQDIAAIAAAMKNINKGRLNTKGLLVILSHASGLAQKEVKVVLEAMRDLEKTYLK